MLHSYVVNRGYLKKSVPTNAEEIRDALWIDGMEVSEAEKELVELTLWLDWPDKNSIREIEASSCLYELDGILHMTANILTHSESDNPKNTPVHFILNDKKLITVRYDNPKAFIFFDQRVQHKIHDYKTPIEVLLGLLEGIIDRSADILEQLSDKVEILSGHIFNRSNKKHRSDIHLTDIVDQIGRSDAMISDIHQSLMSVNRMAKFLIHHTQDVTTRQELHIIEHDINSLVEHTNYLLQKLSFFLDATMGHINIEQNGIIKIFSVAAVIFMPPTLVASIYGMNFKYMPELEWSFGYPLALSIMVLAAIVPYLFFKYKKWL
jgi:magnesium transporter